MPLMREGWAVSGVGAADRRPRNDMSAAVKGVMGGLSPASSSTLPSMSSPLASKKENDGAALGVTEVSSALLASGAVRL